MKIEYTQETPRKIRDYDQEEPILSSEEVEDIAEITVGGSELYEPRCWKHHSYFNEI